MEEVSKFVQLSKRKQKYREWKELSIDEQNQIMEQYDSVMKRSQIMRLHKISSDHIQRIVRNTIRKNPRK